MQSTFNTVRKYGSNLRSRAAKAGALLSLATLNGLAMAADVDAVTEIQSQQTKALAICGALLAMGVAIWGALYIYRKFFK